MTTPASASALDLDRPQLERLALSPHPRLKTPLPGADLVLLGIVKKPKP